MYIPLNNKSNYSLLSSLIKIDDLVDFAVSHNIPGIGLCDINMYGVMEFVKKCHSNNINPIVGLNVNLEWGSLCLYVVNYDGYKNIIKISTIQNERIVDFDDLKKYCSNLICVIPYEYRNKYEFLTEIFDNVYIGYSSLSEENDAKLITNNVLFFREVLYVNSSDSMYLPYLYMIRDSKTVTDDFSYDFSNHGLVIDDIYSYTDNEGLISSLRINDICNLEFPHFDSLLPIYECSDPSKYLFELCKVGLNKRLNGNVNDTYRNRLSYELNIINNMGFCNYFLVVYDFIKYAKKNGILVGPGRGSAAGSLVAYSLGITEIDPLKYDLLFERFLNPERKSMPDIDTDFPDSKRDDVIKYVISKYGKKRVSGIVTFGTLGAKQVIRDLSRVFNIPVYKVDKLSHFISSSHDKLTDIYKNNMSFKVMVDSDLSLSKMYKIAVKLEGFPRHISSHAAGIIMSRVDLDEVIPLTVGDDIYLSCYSTEYLEEFGLLKMDFLGLKNLTIISDILDDIYKYTGNLLDFNKIPLDDVMSLEVFKNGRTSGIFQFESSGMKNFLRRLNVDCIEDVFAAIALFRPGPAINIDSYIRRKSNLEDIDYFDLCLEPILKSTYGIFIYQEQIIQVANVFAGYSLGEADILRRAMSKKKFDLLKSEEDKFIKKSMDNGHSFETSKKIFDVILNFAGYGFNKSHSVAYSIIAYKMVYLKAHYGLIFFANLLTSVIGSDVKTREFIMEAKSNKYIIKKPDINISYSDYIVYNDMIYCPISCIKSIGRMLSLKIIKERENKSFNDIYDAFCRLYNIGFNKDNFLSLIYADCFSCFGYNKKTLVKNLDNLYNYAELSKDIDASYVMVPDVELEDEYDSIYLLEKELLVFGFYLSSHPTTIYEDNNRECVYINNIDKYFSKNVYLLVLVDRVKVINTKKGEDMAFVTGSDKTGSMEFTLFPKVYNIYSNIKKGDIVKIYGRVEKRFNQYQIIVSKIIYLNGDSYE